MLFDGPTRQTQTRRLALIAVGTLVLTAFGGSGCNPTGGKNHEQWVNQADQRYRNLRTGLILEMARQHFDAGDLENAESAIQDALEIDPTNAKLLTLAARVKLERGRLERAFHLFNLALEHQPKNPEAHYFQAVVLQRWKRFADAAEGYRTAYELEADNVGYLIAWAEMLVETGDTDGAIELLREREDYFDQSAGLRISLGQLLLVANRPEKAIPVLEEAAVLAPQETRVQEDLAMAHAAAGNYGEAISLYERLIADLERGERPDLKRALAEACRAAKQHDRAKALYLELAREHPGSGAWMSLAEMSFERGDADDVLFAARRALQADASAHRAYVLMGLVWQQRGNLDEALRNYDLAAARSRGDAVPLILRGIALQKAGKHTAAAEAYRQALDRKPGDARATRLLNSLASVPAS